MSSEKAHVAMNGKTLVSVIIPTFHRKESLIKALDSLKSQTYTCVEIILVDDNADPEWNEPIWMEIEKRVAQQIVYIRNERHLGAAESRNIGIRIAKGEYVTFLDDDDFYLPDKIAVQLYDMLQKDADFSITDLYLYNEDDKLVDRRIRSYLDKADMSDRNALIKYHLMYHMTGTDTLMFKKSYLHTIGCFPELVIGEEFCLMLSAIEHGGVLTYLPGCQVKAYVHNEINCGLSTDFIRKSVGEKELYSIKQKYFGRLDRRSVRYIRMRHYAVLAYADFKLRRYCRFFVNGVKLFASAPISAIHLLFSHLRY